MHIVNMFMIEWGLVNTQCLLDVTAVAVNAYWKLLYMWSLVEYCIIVGIWRVYFVVLIIFVS